MSPAELKAGAKQKQAAIKLKDFPAVIESIKFSEDSSKLLVCYKAKEASRDKEESKVKSQPEFKVAGSGGYKIIEWDVEQGYMLRQYGVENRVSHAQYLPFDENIVLTSGSLPYLITDFEKKECIINEKEYEQQFSKVNEKDEQWIVKSLDFKQKKSFAVFSKDLNVLAIIERDEVNTFRRKDYSAFLKKDEYKISHEQIRKIIEYRDEADSQQEMETDTHEDSFQTFQKLFNVKNYSIKAYCCMRSEVTDLIISQHNSIVIVNCLDKNLRLFDVSDETLNKSSQQLLKIHPFREFSDIVLKRKFAGGMIYNVPEDKDMYLLTGIAKAGELIAYSVKMGSQHARVGNWKEGCEHMAYFYNDMKNFTIVYITSMSSVVVWKKPIIKNFEALSPHFSHIEQNEVYKSTEEAKHIDENEDYIEPRSELSLKDCFKAESISTDIKKIPARLHLNDNVTELCRSKITTYIKPQ